MTPSLCWVSLASPRAEGCNALTPDGAPETVLGTRLAAQVRQLHDTNLHYAAKQGGFDRARQHRRWRSDVELLVAQILATVTDMAEVPRTVDGNS